MPCDKLRALRHKKTYQRHPVINKLVSQASQVEEKCFRSKRPNFASKNAFSPSAALRAAACKARVLLGQVRQEKKSQNKSPEAMPRGFVLAPPNVLARFWTLNHATRLKANAFRREFATWSQSSPLSAPFGRAGWSVRVQEGEPTKKARRLACFPLAPPAGLEPATP